MSGKCGNIVNVGDNNCIEMVYSSNVEIYVYIYIYVVRTALF